MKLLVLLALAAAACAPSDSPAAPANHSTAPPSATGELEVEYHTWGLMPAPQCGSPTYEITLARDRAVTCGWRSTCPPYSDTAPLRASAKGRLTIEQTNRLAEIAAADAFFALPPFTSNVHIIDGGEESLRVQVGRRDKTVEMANTSAPAFTAVRDALQAATGCSIATAGPMPH